MSIDYIRQYYGVNAIIGGRVEYTGSGNTVLGTIIGAQGAHLMIKLDGDDYPAAPYHPTWKLRFLDKVRPVSETSDPSDDDIPF